MQAADAYNGIEPQVETRAYDEQGRELQDAVLRCLMSFRRNALRYLSNVADAEDAVQDALLSAYKHLDQFRGQAQMSTWLTAIVTNCARMQLRKRPRAIHRSLDEAVGRDREYSLSEVLADDAPNPEDKCRQSELHSRLMQFVEQLSPALQTTYQLRELEGLSISQTAQILGLAEGTIKAQLARARAKLTKLMRAALRPTGRGRAHSSLPGVAKQ
jgi:RNA polymerase sigma-70 factor (ECF subfamily)